MADKNLTPSVHATALSLDDLYHMVANIYGERNAERPVSATFAHFVEVCGVLTAHDRGKTRQQLSIEDALCKALGWFFPLMAKFRVASVEDLVFRKFPRVCPYCRLTPHNEAVCKNVRGTERTVDKDALRIEFQRNASNKPVTLDDWQKMFRDIYPRNMTDVARSTLGLFEELGELAEAIRVFDQHPKFFAGEAADVFSYLMGFANELFLRAETQDRTFSFEAEFIQRYPGLCTQCGHHSCICPVVPEATVGRMAKELEVAPHEQLFSLDSGKSADHAKIVSRRVLDRLGGFSMVARRFPFDRGTQIVLQRSLPHSRTTSRQAESSGCRGTKGRGPLERRGGGLHPASLGIRLEQRRSWVSPIRVADSRLRVADRRFIACRTSRPDYFR